MKIKWSVEGAGCNLAGCGLPDFTIEIEDEELDGLNERQRDERIDQIVDEEFRQRVYPFWEIVE